MINLNVHSSFEFLNSNIQIDPLLDSIEAFGQKAVAITDFNFLHSAYQFIDKALKRNINPIVGIEIGIESDMESVPMLLYAKNMEGFHYLSKLSSRLSYKNLQKTPVSFLHDISECIAVLKNSTGIPILEALNIPENDKYLAHTVNQGNYKKAFITPSYYMKKDDASVIPILNAIRDNTRLNPYETYQSLGSYFVKSNNDLTELETDYLQVNEEIVNKCHLERPTVRYTLPKYVEESSDSYLWNELEIAFNKKIKTQQEQYYKRLKYEFETIVEMKYEDYFLIVSDLIRYAKNNNIYVGPGRGSSSASLVSYLLDITDLDPLEYDLLFERFLNKERVSMPDIDIDFASVDVPKVIQYLEERYGKMHVAHILTYNNLTAKSVARDIGRIYGLKDNELNEISNIIEENSNNLKTALNSERYQNLIEIDEKYKILKENALKIEGLPRNTSIHASGILLGRNPLTDDIPIMFDGEVTKSQWPMEDCEQAGLLKIDVLSLNTLSLIRHMNNRVKHRHKNFDINQVPLDDEKTFKCLSYGVTSGIFQLESTGITRVIERYKPNSLLDLALVLAMYRPGPMGQIDDIIRIKHGKSKAQYPHKDLEDILIDTYGVMIFQEQIMQTTRKIAGFTFQEADITRRAMAKKNRDELMRERSKFIEGATKKGYTLEVSEHLFNLIMKFADYGFPKSHALVYAIVSYRMAYLKTHYPYDFYSVILLEHSKEKDKLEKTLEELKLMQIKIHRPSINHSLFQNTVNKGIVLGFSMIKYINKNLADKIIHERNNRPFSDFYDFVSRLSSEHINERQLRMLVLSGALDDFNETRKSLLQNIKKALNTVKDDVNQVTLLDVLGYTRREEDKTESEMNSLDLIEGEKESMGFFISTHPITLKHQEFEYIPFDMLEHHENKFRGMFLVYIMEVRSIKTKKNEEMAYIKVTDGMTQMDAVLFPRNYIINLSKLKQDMLVIDGYIDMYNNKTQVVINRLYIVDDYVNNYLNNTKYIIIRNYEHLTINQFLGDKGVPVYNINREEIGKCTKENSEKLIEILGKENIRMMV